MSREPWVVTGDMFLSVKETDTLLAHVLRHEREAEGDDALAPAVDRLIVESLLFSGVRNTEFCRLTLADVALDAEPAFSVRGTPREDRTVFLPQHLADLLRRFIAEIRPHLLPPGVNPRSRSQPLVVNERGRAYERTGLYRRVVRILAEAGLGARASVQLLRHTYGYLAYLRTGGNLLFCQRQLGHAHPMVTAVYAEFVKHSYVDLANAVAGLADNSSSSARGRAKPRAISPRG